MNNSTGLVNMQYKLIEHKWLARHMSGDLYRKVLGSVAE